MLKCNSLSNFHVFKLRFGCLFILPSKRTKSSFRQLSRRSMPPVPPKTHASGARLVQLLVGSHASHPNRKKSGWGACWHTQKALDVSQTFEALQSPGCKVYMNTSFLVVDQRSTKTWCAFFCNFFRLIGQRCICVVNTIADFWFRKLEHRIVIAKPGSSRLSTWRITVYGDAPDNCTLPEIYALYLLIVTSGLRTLNGQPTSLQW